jgi:hypothetical protein
LVSRIKDLLKKLAETLLPGDIRDLPAMKDRAVELWSTVKSRIGVKTNEDDGIRTEPDDEDNNPFV